MKLPDNLHEDFDLTAVYYLTRGVHASLGGKPEAEDWQGLGEDGFIGLIIQWAICFENWCSAAIEWDSFDEIWCYYLEETVAPALAAEIIKEGYFGGYRNAPETPEFYKAILQLEARLYLAC